MGGRRLARKIVSIPHHNIVALLMPAVARYVRTDKSVVGALHGVRYKFDDTQCCLMPSEGVPRPMPSGRASVVANQAYQPIRPSIQAIDFSMQIILNDSSAHTGRFEPRHTCSTVQSSVGSQPKPLADYEDLRAYFPDLEDRLSDGLYAESDILMLESNIDPVKERPSERKALSISCGIDITCPPGLESWSVQTQFYQDIGQHESSYGPQDLVNRETRYTRVKLLDFPLHASWWKRLFEKACDERQKARESSDFILRKANHGDWYVLF